MRGFLALSSLFAAAVVVHAQIFKNETLEIANAFVQPDGANRSAVVVNGKTPGHTLTAFKGDTLVVNVVNHLTDPDMRRSTTIHWHGILQHRTAYDDGPAFVTQCPIAPTNSYTYHIQTGTQAGTYWYHSHLSSQYIDGLRGALIVYDPNDPHQALYDFDNETTIISLTDWYQTSAEILGDAWLNGNASIPIPDSNLFNGVGRFRGGDPVERPVMVVQQGKSYRFRIINMSAMVPFNFAIEGHNLTIIEVDGENHQPHLVSSVSISAGQRYSVVLNASKDVDNYCESQRIAYPSNFNEVTLPGNENYNGTEAFAVLHYDGAGDPKELEPPAFVPDDSRRLIEEELEPLESPSLPEVADMVIPLRFSTNGTKQWIIDGRAYVPPKLPTLLQILRNGATNDSDFEFSENTHVIPPNMTIDVQLIGGPNHPFHLHGHTFQVIRSANRRDNVTGVISSPGRRNTRNPPIRDTVDTNSLQDPEQAVTIRFRTDNPGPWFLHCHKDWHLEAGLAVVFAEAPEAQRTDPDSSVNPPPAWDELCEIYGNLPEELQ